MRLWAWVMHGQRVRERDRDELAQAQRDALDALHEQRERTSALTRRLEELDDVARHSR